MTKPAHRGSSGERTLAAGRLGKTANTTNLKHQYCFLQGRNVLEGERKEIEENQRQEGSNTMKKIEN